MDPITLLTFGKSILDKFIADPGEKEAAQLALLKAHQDGDLKELETRLSAIITEAKSSDPWTSRARPSFLYTMYAMILFSIPMGFLFAAKPEVAQAVIAGVQGWLAALPQEMWYLFGAGYLGYVKHRSDDKARLIGQPVTQGLIGKLFG